MPLPNPALKKKTVRRLLWPWRKVTWKGRALPDFIILGAQKAGTGSLYYYLSEHPAIHPPLVKEVHYFDGGLDPAHDSFARGEAWYRAHFPRRKRLRDGDLVFEASPLYLFNPLVAERIAASLPQVKLIVLLRDPVARAVSHYFMSVRRGFEKLPLLQALLAEEERLAPLLAKREYKSPVFIHNSYKRRGLYAEQLERFFRHFGREQLLILESDAFFQHPEQAVKEVFDFVGVDSTFRPQNLKPRNVARNRSSVDEEAVVYLKEYFQAPNRKLYDLLGRDFGW